MKTTKLLLTLFISIMLFSCEEDDSVNVVELSEAPSFTATVSPEDSGLYYFENTTPNKGDFYSYFEISDANVKYNGNEILEYAFGSSGTKTITLTVIGTYDNDVVTQEIDVVLPPPSDVRVITNPENLFANGYLLEGEGDEFTNWSKNNGAANMTAEATDVLVGFRALKVSNSEEGPEEWKVQFVSDPTPTVVDEQYTVSMWLKGAPNEVRFSTNPGVGGDQYAGGYTITEDWTQYSWTFTANSATTIVALDMGKSLGTFLVDAIELVPGTTALPLPANDSALLNGDLEEGDGADFANWSQNNGADNMTEELTNVLSGSRALKVSNAEEGPEEWKVQFVSDAFDTESGATYTASIWIKGAGAEVRYSTNPGLGNEQYAGNYTATDEWTKYSWTFTANTATTLLSLDMGKSAATFYVDAIKVVKD
ncbi:carbohydrate binding domain-containing protein [Cellulophaga baltica]|uniref:carbohydrate binding domain-containing protein n=1 Tax=Cellulophaga baltica TaxID=76594 RepID=UPI002493FD48|nr:carbohydrate binding domain-containing protein [Cellulophaga baltica]